MAEKKQSYCAGCSEAELKLFEPAIEQLISLANEEILPRFWLGQKFSTKKITLRLQLPIAVPKK